MNRTFCSILVLLASVTLPACFALAGASGSIVRFVYGSVWAPAAAVLLILGVGAGIRICFELTYDFLVVRGRSGAIFSVQVIWILAMVPALVFGAHWQGIAGVASAQVVVMAVIVVPLYGRLLIRAGLSVGSLARSVALPFLVAVAVGVACYLVSHQIASALLGCVLGALICLAGIAGLLLRSHRTLLALWHARKKAAADSDPDEVTGAALSPAGHEH